MSRKLTLADLAKHTDRYDLYTVINDKVIDLTKFVDEHPGGEEVLVDQGGKDASDAFESVGHSPDARRILETLVIGTLDKRESHSSTRPSTTTKAPKAPAASKSSSVFLCLMLVLSAFVAYGIHRIQLL